MLHFYPPIFLSIEKSFKENVSTEDTEVHPSYLRGSKAFNFV
jgi:hypothetical protein